MKLLEYLDEWLIIHPPTHAEDNRSFVVTITDFRESTRNANLTSKIKQRQRYDRDKIIELYRKFVHFNHRPPNTLEEFCWQDYAPSRGTIQRFFRDLDDLISAAGPISIPSFTPKVRPDPALNQRALKAMQLRSASIRQIQRIGFNQLTGVTEDERQRLQKMTQQHARTEHAKSIAYRLMERWMSFQTKSRDEYLHRITMISCYHGDSSRIHRADYYGFERIVSNIEYRLENNLAIDDATLIRTLTPIREAWHKELAAAQAAEALEAKRRAEEAKYQADEDARAANAVYVTDMEWYRRAIEQTESMRTVKAESRPTFTETSDDERKLRIAQYEVDLWNAAERSNQRKAERRRAASQTASSTNQTATQKAKTASQNRQFQQTTQNRQSNQNSSYNTSNSTHTTYYSHTTTHIHSEPNTDITSQINTFVKDILTNTKSFLRNLFS